MNKELLIKNYVQGNYNCAEVLLVVARDGLGIEVSEGALHALGAFGGGMGCRETCGAVCGAVAAIGCHYIDTVGHDSKLGRELAGQMTTRFMAEAGGIRCEELRPRCFKEGQKCLELCEKAAQILTEIVEANPPR